MAFRRAVLACLCCLSLVAGGLAIQPAVAETCYVPAKVGISGSGPGVVAAAPDGTVVGPEAHLYRYDWSLTERSNATLRDSLTAAQRDALADDVRVAGVEHGPDGRWWLLTTQGLAVSVHGNLTGTGATVRLNGSDPRDLTRAGDTWIVLDRGGLRGYDDEWQSRTVTGGDAVSAASAIAASDGTVLALDGNGTVTRYAISRSANGSLALTRQDAMALALNRSRFGEPMDVTATSDGGWLLLTDERAVLAFDGGESSLTHRGYVANGPTVHCDDTGEIGVWPLAVPLIAIGLLVLFLLAWTGSLVLDGPLLGRDDEA